MTNQKLVLDKEGIAVMTMKDLKLLILLANKPNTTRKEIYSYMKYAEQPTMYLRRTSILCKRGYLKASYFLDCKRGKPRYVHALTEKGFNYLKEVKTLLDKAIQNENKKE